MTLCIRALALVSGGLDSLLAVKVLQEQGIDVVGLSFESPFFNAQNAQRGAEQLGIHLRVVDITEELWALLKDPPHGFGKNMNPCIDCHALMVRKAVEILTREGFDLIATGEVLGERPRSQNRQSLETVARDAGAEAILVRPLSARLLPETQPEREGKVDRSRLLAIEGRSRKPQMELAERYGIHQYQQPAGGCLLTDPAFSVRLRELLDHEPHASSREVRLLTLGRHFRLPSGAKVIVGRNAKDNERILSAGEQPDVLLDTTTIPGPAALLLASQTESDITLSAEICASYADHGNHPLELTIVRTGKREQRTIVPKPRSTFESMRIS